MIQDLYVTFGSGKDETKSGVRHEKEEHKSKMKCEFIKIDYKEKICEEIKIIHTIKNKINESTEKKMEEHEKGFTNLTDPVLWVEGEEGNINGLVLSVK